MIKLEKLNKSYSVQTITGKEIGSFQLDSNGSYYFWEKSDLNGCWSAHTLREIADKLDEVNKPYSDSVKEYFEKQELIGKLRSKTLNFTTHFNTSTLMVGDNYHSGEITIEGITYYIVKCEGKVRVWDTPNDYMAWVSDKKDYILEIDILSNDF